MHHKKLLDKAHAPRVRQHVQFCELLQSQSFLCCRIEPCPTFSVPERLQHERNRLLSHGALQGALVAMKRLSTWFGLSSGDQWPVRAASLRWTDILTNSEENVSESMDLLVPPVLIELVPCAFNCWMYWLPALAFTS